MDNQHEQAPEALFDLIEKIPFESLSQVEQEEVVQYFSREEYDELHTVSQLIHQSMRAGSTSAYQPAKARLLRQFDKTYTGASIFSMASSLLKIAAVFLLVLSGWLYHYLASYSHKQINNLAVADTVYLSPQTIIKYDTIYIDRSLEDRQQAHPMQNLMQEKRDATEYQPAHRKAIQTRTPVPPANREQDNFSRSLTT